MSGRFVVIIELNGACDGGGKDDGKTLGIKIHSGGNSVLSWIWKK